MKPLVEYEISHSVRINSFLQMMSCFCIQDLIGIDIPRRPTPLPVLSTTKSAGRPAFPPYKPGPYARTVCGPTSSPTPT